MFGNHARRGGHLALTAALAVGLLAGACSKSDQGNAGAKGGSGGSTPGTVVNDNVLEPDMTPETGGKIVVAVTGESNGWNPGLSQLADAGITVVSSVLEPLMTFSADGTYEPWLAESMTAAPGDYSKWTIKVRKGITFHNGEKLDAKVVARNVEYYATKAPLSSLAMKDYFTSATAVDDSTVEVKLTKQWASYPTVQGNGTGMIMANEMLDAEDGGNKRPIGTGPFVFEKWDPDHVFAVKKNPSYWKKDDKGNALPYLDAIDFKPITDSQTRTNGLKSGDIDVVMTNRAADVASTKDDYTVIKDWSSEKTYLLLNVLEDPTKRKNPFKNVHARRALAYATNRQAIVDIISEGEPVTMSDTPVPSSSKFSFPDSEAGYYPFDQAKAKEEIELFKKDTGYDEISFEFSGLANTDDRTIMQALQQQWAQVGIKCTISTAEQTNYILQLVNSAYQVGYFRNYAYPDPDGNFYFWSSSTAKGLGVLSINFNQYKSDIIDKALEKSRSTEDAAVRREAYKELTRELNSAAINTWLFNTPFSLITQKNVHGMNSARQRSFGNFLPHPWLFPYVWKQKA